MATKKIVAPAAPKTVAELIAERRNEMETILNRINTDEGLQDSDWVYKELSHSAQELFKIDPNVPRWMPAFAVYVRAIGRTRSIRRLLLEDAQKAIRSAEKVVESILENSWPRSISTDSVELADRFRAAIEFEKELYYVAVQCGMDLSIVPKTAVTYKAPTTVEVAQ